MRRVFLALLVVGGLVALVLSRSPEGSAGSDEVANADAPTPPSHASGPSVQTRDAGESVRFVTRVRYVDEDELPTETPGINGVVTHRSDPVTGADVSLASTHVVSRGEGRFRFEGCLGTTPDGVAVLLARKGRLTSVPVFIDCAHPPVSVRLPLITGAVVDGTVTSAETGRAHSDVVVEVTSTTTDRTVTNLLGHFALEGLAPGTYRLRAMAKGHLTAELPHIVLAAEEHRKVEIALTPAGLLSGVVVDAAGAPVSGASVRAHAGDEELGAAATDAEGRFTVADLRRGRLQLAVAHPEFAPLESTTYVPGSVRLVLLRGGEIRGVVVDEHPAPVPDLTVRLEGGEPRQASEARSDVSGAFVFPHLRAGSYRVSPHTLGWRGASARVDVHDGEVAKVRLEVEPTGGFVRGEVRDARTGEPVPGAVVSFREANAITGRVGEFALEGLVDGVEGLVTASALGYVEGGELVRVPESHAVIDLQRPVIVRGRVVDRDGAPVVRFSVKGHPVVSLTGSFAQPIAPTCGRHALYVSAEGFRRTAIGTCFKKDTDVGEVTLRPTETTTVVVLDEGGTPVAGAQVFEARPGPLLPQLTSGGATALGTTNGTGEITYVSSGQFEPIRLCVGAVHPLFSPADVPRFCSPIVAHAVHLVLPRASWIRGHVRSTSAFRANAVVGELEEGTTSLIDEQGRFRLGPLHPGVHTVFAFSGSSKGAGLQVTVAAGQEVDIELP